MSLYQEQPKRIQELENRLSLNPADLGLRQQLAQIYMECGLSSKALAALEANTQLAPTNQGVQMSYALSLFQLGQHDAAERQFRRVLAISPNNGKANICLGQLLQIRGDFKASIPHLQAAASISNRDPVTLKMLGYSALRGHDYTLAEKTLQNALALSPNDPEVLTYLGVTLNFLRRANESEEHLRKAALLAPHNELVLFSHAENLLLRGQVEEGFTVYERALNLRRGNPVNKLRQRTSHIPGWQNQTLEGQHLLAWIDQGHGDAIMLIRYARELLDKGLTRLSILGHASLKRLFETLDPRVSYIDSASATPLEGPTLCCSLSSLPARLGTTSHNIPAQVPYFTVPDSHISQFASQVESAQNSLKVGLTWSGNPETPLHHLRSAPLALFAPLASIKGVSLVNLEYGDERKQVSRAGFAVLDPMDQVADFLDTAALICNLDLVIAVDTAVAHLAGALNKPVWLLNRYESEWRWMLDRTDSPWYPSMRIFNQKQQGNWKPVINAIRQELEILAFKNSRAKT